MKYLQTCLISVMLLGSGMLRSQTNVIDTRPFIEVTGTAELEVVPDEIYIYIVVREKYVNKEKVSIDAQEEKIKSALQNLGIDLKNFGLADANADYVKVKWRTKDVLTKKEYLLKVPDAKTVGKVFVELDKLEIEDAGISRVSHSELERLIKETKIKAIKAAKSKADYLLEAIGEQTGKPMEVKEKVSEFENGSFNPYRGNVYRKNDTDSDGYDKEKVEIQFSKIKIRSSVYIKFLIK